MPLDERTVRSNLRRDLVNGAGGAPFLAAVYANGAVAIARLGADPTTVAVLTTNGIAVNVAMLLLTPFIPRNRPVVLLVVAVGLLVEHRQFREFALAWACWGAGVLAPLGVYPVLLVDRFHASYTAIGLLGAITGLSSLVTYRWWARHADRRDPRLLADAGVAIAAAVPAIYGVAPSFAPLAVAAVASGASVGAMEMGNLQAMLRLAPPGEGVRYTAVFNAITGLRGAIVPIVGSAMVAHYGAEPVLLVAALIGIASAAYMAASSRTPLSAPGA